jgi:hypothetical protein
MFKKIFKTKSQNLNLLFIAIHKFIFSKILSSELKIKTCLIFKESLKKRNFSAFIFLSFIFYKSYSGLSFDIGLLSLILSSLISFSISHFVLNEFEYSANIYIGLIQRLIIYNIIIIFGLAFAFYLFYLFGLIPTLGPNYCFQALSGEEDNLTNKNKEILTVKTETDDKNNEYYNFKIEKKLLDSYMQFGPNVAEVSKFTANKIIPNLGAGTAAGYATASTIKSTSGLPPVQRAAAIFASALITITATKVGLELGTALTKQTFLDDLIKESPQALNARKPDDIIPSLEPNIINSTLENNDLTSPLQDLLIYSFALDICILLSIVTLLVIIFNRYVYSFNLNFINSILNKYIHIKWSNWFNKKLNTGIDYNNKFVLIMFIINSIGLILMIFLKIFITSELLVNIDSYIAVHNYIHCK